MRHSQYLRHRGAESRAALHSRQHQSLGISVCLGDPGLGRGLCLARHIHVVMDNLNIHCRKSLTDHLGAKQGRYLWRRLKAHYTPKHGGWLNQAEIELSLVSRQCLGTRRLPQPQPPGPSVGTPCLERLRQPCQHTHPVEVHPQCRPSQVGYKRNTTKRPET